MFHKCSVLLPILQRKAKLEEKIPGTSYPNTVIKNGKIVPYINNFLIFFSFWRLVCE